MNPIKKIKMADLSGHFKMAARKTGKTA